MNTFEGLRNKLPVMLPTMDNLKYIIKTDILQTIKKQKDKNNDSYSEY